MESLSSRDLSSLDMLSSLVLDNRRPNSIPLNLLIEAGLDPEARLNYRAQPPIDTSYPYLEDRSFEHLSEDALMSRLLSGDLLNRMERLIDEKNQKADSIHFLTFIDTIAAFPHIPLCFSEERENESTETWIDRDLFPTILGSLPHNENYRFLPGEDYDTRILNCERHIFVCRLNFYVSRLRGQSLIQCRFNIAQMRQYFGCPAHFSVKHVLEELKAQILEDMVLCRDRIRAERRDPDITRFTSPLRVTRKDNDQPECPICKDQITNGEGVLTKPCGHIFCRECLRKWVATTMQNGHTCPSCRTVISKSVSDMRTEYRQLNDFRFRIRSVQHSFDWLRGEVALQHEFEREVMKVDDMEIDNLGPNDVEINGLGDDDLWS